MNFDGRYRRFDDYAKKMKKSSQHTHKRKENHNHQSSTFLKFQE